MDNTSTDDRVHVADLVDDAQVAVLTTAPPERRRESRPTGLQEAELDRGLRSSAVPAGNRDDGPIRNAVEL